MIDFPTLFPNLVKYIPNWMERFYPSLAQFARGEGYPCGNKGVFIPRRNKCWTHPKTGQRMRKPLTYQLYQDAKEKSQRSKTEKGRTALQNREQGFRDKAREKVKGWQNKVKEANLAPERVKSPNGYLLPIEGDPVFTYTGGLTGSSKWKGKVLKVNPDGKTIVIEKGWEKTKAGKPGRMTVNRGEWKVEDDPQIQKDNDRILGEKRQQEVEEEKLLKQSIYSVDNAIKIAIDSGKEKPITRDELKKGDTFYQYLNMKRTGDHLKQEYEYTSDGNAREILPNRKKGSEVRVLGTTGKERITAPTSVEARVGTVKVKIDPKEPAPPTPKLKSKDNFANDKYDKWLISESQKLEGKEKSYNIGTKSGKKSVKGKVYENFGIHEDRGRYNLTQLSSGRALNYYDDEEQAKKSIVELNRSGIDWKLNEKELQDIPGIQTKMKSVKRKIDAVIESDKRVKDSIKYYMSQHRDSDWDYSEELAELGVEVPKKKKNNFNSHLNITEFAKPGCCCDASKPLRRRKTKQTPRLKRRGNRYA